jgi:hypothetical protein
VDGYQVSTNATDNLSRAFDLAGRNLWIDSNKFNNTGSSPGNDGEGIVCLAKKGTPIYSWAITRNVHTRGSGSAGMMGGWDADCHGLLIGWNQTSGWVGNEVKRKDTRMTDCAFIANKCLRTYPDAKTIAKFGLKAPLLTSGKDTPAAPTKVTAEAHQKDAVKITWTDVADNEVGFRVERQIGDGKWQVIAYRPPRLQGDLDNPQEWVDFTAPPEKELKYRVVAINGEDNDKGASNAATVTLKKTKE